MEKDIEFLHEMFPLDRDIIYDTYISSNRNIDDTISSLIRLCSKDTLHPPTYEEAVSNGIGACSSHSSDSELSKKRRDSRRNLGKKEWKAPVIGKLSDDFLTVPNEILNNSAPTGFNCKGCAKLKPKECSDEPCASHNATVMSPTLVSNIGDIDTIIRKRMEDNVSQTRYATLGMNSSTDSIQYLDDERLALMLQNQEFRKMVKSDPEFRAALQEDIKDQDGGESIDIWHERDDGDKIRPQDLDIDYGYERSDIVEPYGVWPDRPSVSPNHDVTTIVKAMGKASKKRLGSIARRFSSLRRTRTSKNYSDIDSFVDFPQPTTTLRPDRWETESTQNLLLSECDSESCLDGGGHQDQGGHHHQQVSVVSGPGGSNSTLI